MKKSPALTPLSRRHRISYIRSAELRSFQGRRPFDHGRPIINRSEADQREHSAASKIRDNLKNCSKEQSALNDFKTISSKKAHSPSQKGIVERTFKTAKSPDLKLYTATVVCTVAGVEIHVFSAAMVQNPLQMRKRLERRCGSDLAQSATIMCGFDHSEPIACEMVSEAVAEILRLATRFPSSSIADRLDYHVEQHFAC